MRELINHPTNQGELTTTKEVEELVYDVSSRAVGLITMTRSQYKFQADKNKKGLDINDVKKLFCVNIAPSEFWLKNLEAEQFDIFSKNLQARQDKLVFHTYKQLLFSKHGY